MRWPFMLFAGDSTMPTLSQRLLFAFTSGTLGSACDTFDAFPKGSEMKYEVTYRLLHPQYLPTTSITTVDAKTHMELDHRLSKVVIKWQARGYVVQIVRVTPKKRARLKMLPQRK
jgi:hypothetical protein